MESTDAYGLESTDEYGLSLPTIGLVSKYEQWTILGYTNRKDNVDGNFG